MGPVQVLVVGFDQATFSARCWRSSTGCGGRGVVRLVDMLLVSRTEEGSLESVSMPAGSAPDRGLVAATLLGEGGDAEQSADAGDDDAGWSLAAVPPGSMAAVGLIERLWAAPLTAALQRPGGRPLEKDLARPDDRRALEALLRRPAAAAVGLPAPASSRSQDGAGTCRIGHPSCDEPREGRRQQPDSRPTDDVQRPVGADVDPVERDDDGDREGGRLLGPAHPGPERRHQATVTAVCADG
jgi:hypothetical protein